MERAFFNKNLSQTDDIIKKFIGAELNRQQNSIELIASENIVSKAVLEAQGSILTNKYAEGYPGKRYYGGCEYVDEIEKLAIERVKKLYSANFANVQPHSGSQANQAVFSALLKPYDKIVSLSLDCGGHLTHGSKVNLSGKWFEIEHYFVDKVSYELDYDEITAIVDEAKPKLIIAGGSAYPRKIDFAKFRLIADKVGAYLLADMAHISGIVAAGCHQNPVKYAHIVTSTTHKTLRGPRGGIILTNHEDIAKKVNSGIFPGIQGGPLMHVIAAKAVAFGEALQQSFNDYIKQVLVNARVLAEELMSRGYNVVTGGTDTHLILVDLRKQNITGKIAEESLEKVGLTCNKNGIPFDDAKPFVTSGIRLGTPAATTRGFKEEEFKLVANLIADVLDELANNENINLENEQIYLKKVIDLCVIFPIY
ncbi:serine hydroxymethyltransferase [Candidatus Aquarickettsia rohweri]|uniref:Serine hydroxymethyltransferase n=1 Tax=Candidatus Aquarickettsia rohweri TaxID=2602574 RepID=A0A429XMW9_9RICK|nr:serine hydroxymethyltransferase [Candidatus Aquarickettsia rohweri]RST67796.1 serine hydroxymethyltransferase [Candidatus Aquarickettsia rohweri]